MSNRQSPTLLSLDVGEKRIGVAIAEHGVKIAVPLMTINVDGREFEQIADLITDRRVTALVVGYPRNQKGESTEQSHYVEQFVGHLRPMIDAIYYQDESLTSVLAEQQLKAMGKPYEKGDIDAQAAALILQDYLEQR